MLELEIITQHLRLDEPVATEEANLLDTYATAAARLVENRTGRLLYATQGDIPTDPDTNEPIEAGLVLDDDITTAMLLLIGHWYENRESVVIGSSTATLPMAVDALIKPYQHYNV